MKHEYALVIGAWRDVISSLNEVKNSGIRKIILSTNMNQIKDFLLCQDFVDDVSLIPFSHEIYAYGVDRNKNIPESLSSVSANIKNCSFHMGYPFIRYDIIDKLNVSKKSINWAQSVNLPDNFILFYPYSLGNSCPLERHWPHWKELLKYLLEKKYNLVVCGINYDFSEFDSYSNFHDFINVTDSFEDVFALALKANKIITTHNGLSLFCTANNLNTTVIMNLNGNSVFNGFNRNIYNSNITKIDYDSTFLEAISMLNKKIKKTSIEHYLLNFPYLSHTEIADLNKKHKAEKIPKDIKSIYSDNFNFYILAYILKNYKIFKYQVGECDADSHILSTTLEHVKKEGLDLSFSINKNTTGIDYIWKSQE
jgi:23S rRNA pseudoU1915 N3-methylase RlmH